MITSDPESQTLVVGSANLVNWRRLTATDGPVFPNPTVDFFQGVQFYVFANRPVYVAPGLRETSTTAPPGGSGG